MRLHVCLLGLEPTRLPELALAQDIHDAVGKDAVAVLPGRLARQRGEDPDGNELPDLALEDDLVADDGGDAFHDDERPGGRRSRRERSGRVESESEQAGQTPHADDASRRAPAASIAACPIPRPLPAAFSSWRRPSGTSTIFRRERGRLWPRRRS